MKKLLLIICLFCVSLSYAADKKTLVHHFNYEEIGTQFKIYDVSGGLVDPSISSATVIKDENSATNVPSKMNESIVKTQEERKEYLESLSSSTY